MLRFLAIFTIVLMLGLIMLAAVLSQYGYSLFDPEMQVMIAVCIAVAAYVGWRINGILKNREMDLADRPAPGGAGQGKLAGLFSGGRNKTYADRQARLEARRRKLIEEGKMSADEAPPPPPAAPEPAAPAPGSSAAMRDRMAARAERVRKAREEGKI
ncbi:MAG TPA: hypothetical protein PKV67_07960 [Hyphomonas sp.]|nr:hypothetical protein [Hyphomonas sp.]